MTTTTQAIDLSGQYYDCDDNIFTAQLTTSGTYKTTREGSSFVIYTQRAHAHIYVEDGMWRPVTAHEAPDDPAPRVNGDECPYCDDHYEHILGDCPNDPANYDGPIPSENDPLPFARGVMVLLALFLALATHTASASPDCTITGTTGEGFPVATCADGSTYYQDLDGQPYPNAAGAPVYCPGTWIPCDEC